MKRYEFNRLIRQLLDVSIEVLAEEIGVGKFAIILYEKGLIKSKPIEQVIELALDKIAERDFVETFLTSYKYLINSRPNY